MMNLQRTAWLVSSFVSTMFLIGCIFGGGTKTEVIPTVAMPSFSPTTASISTGQTITISDSTAGATIFYTLDGTTPTTSSAAYKIPFPLTASATVKAIAVASGQNNSDIATATFALSMTQLPTPAVAPRTATFSTNQTVQITDTNTSAAIFYTTDGTTPSKASTPYTTAIPVSFTQTIRAIAILAGYSDSAIDTETITINPAMPAITLTASTRAVTQGSSMVLSWTISNASACTATSSDGSWNVSINPASGAAGVTPKTLGIQNFVLTCSNGNLSATAVAPVTVSMGAVSCVDLLIPLYVYPIKTDGTPEPQWTTVVSDSKALKASGRTRFIIAAGSSDANAITAPTAPAPIYNPLYVNVIGSVKAGGASPILYVHTSDDGYNLRSLSTVTAEVQRQMSYYGPTTAAGGVGIFVDVVVGTPANLAYYNSLLTNIAAVAPKATVVFNIGITAPTPSATGSGYTYVSTEPYAKIVPPTGTRLILNIEENYGYLYPAAGTDSQRAWMFNYPASTFSIILHTMDDSSQVAGAIDNAIRGNVGTAYFTDQRLGLDPTTGKETDPYADLPSTAFYNALTSITNSGCPKQ